MRSIVIELALVSAMVAGGAAVVAHGAVPSPLTGTCLSPGAALPCSVSVHEANAGLRMNSTRTDHSQLEEVLARVIGPPVAVQALSGDLTRSGGDSIFSPSELTGAQRFWWSYTGSAQNLAYMTVHSAGRFAIIGVAGMRVGAVDVSNLLDGQPITHVQLWTTLYSKADPIVPTALHGDGLSATCA